MKSFRTSPHTSVKRCAMPFRRSPKACEFALLPVDYLRACRAAGAVASAARHRSSGTCHRGRPPHTRCKTCTRRSRSAHRENPAEDRCRNIRSWGAIQAWMSPDRWSGHCAQPAVCAQLARMIYPMQHVSAETGCHASSSIHTRHIIDTPRQRNRAVRSVETWGP